MNQRIWALMLAAVATLGAAKPLSKDAIFKHYQGLNAMTAEVIQTKQSPYLIKPISTRVDVRFAKNQLTWKPDGQEAMVVQFKPDGSSQILGESKLNSQIPAAAVSKLQGTFATIRNVITMNPSLEHEFDLVLEGRRLHIRPKTATAEHSILFQSMTVDFKEDLSLDSVSVTTAEDITTLKFKNLKIEK